MKTFKLSLLFLLIPFISKGQQECEGNFVSVVAVVSQTSQDLMNFLGVLEISSVTNNAYLPPTQINTIPVMSYQVCVDPGEIGFTVFITEQNSTPFEGTINLYLDDGYGNADNDNILAIGADNITEVYFSLTALEQGCTDPNAVNYNPNADIDDFSCQIEGCTDGTAFNYNPNANIDDGSCSGPIYGCIDNGTMTNGLGEINDLDGDGLPAFNYDSLANIDDDSCVPINEGCSDPEACNYNSAVNTANNNLCSFPIGCETCEEGIVIDNDEDGDGICDGDETLGCQDPLALNYNPNATDPGTCIYPDIDGCMNPNACNYNPAATIPTGGCLIPENCDTCSEGFVVDNDSDNDGVCDADEISGCTDPTACGYNPDATDDDETCFNSEQYYDCDGACINDTNNNDICDELEIAGCTDNSACNYNTEANMDDGTCYFAADYYDCDGNCLNDIDGDSTCDQLESGGCTNNNACNYNPYVTEDDGSCESISCYGCMYPNACNYNAMAFYPENCFYASDVSDCATCSGETDGSGTILANDADGDGICDADEIDGCMNDTACNYNANATNEDNSCEFTSCVGCIEENACNYNPEATVSDASCSFPEMYYDCDGACSEDDDSDGICNELEIYGCTDITACNYNPYSTDEGECNFALEYYDCEGNCLNDIDDNTICDELEVFGCTDTDACNYNLSANVNDGSCDFPEEYYDCSGNCINDSDLNGICDELEVGGCTDSEACNYNADATMDNGTCEYLEVTLGYNNLSFSLEASSNAASPIYQWNINGENSNINTNRLNPFINGLYTVSVYDEENDCWGEASYTINDVSINEVESDIKIFPNPVHNTLHIKSKLNNQNTTIEVYNYLGKLLDAYQNMNSQHAQIDVSKLSSGIYIVKLKSQDFITQKEFIKH